VRPIFHWTEKRIKGHFVICFLAFLLERTLEFRLKEHQLFISPAQIQEALSSLLFTEMEINSQRFLVKMRPSDNANKILRILRISPPKNMLPVEEAGEFAW
ncbi:MAG: IS1634 family transposase, partial [Firmicutes bacterium]|nr:IS1634 family transposase [Bacillota bacterium]